MKIAAIVLMLLTVATSASAECAWVLWHQYTFVNWPEGAIPTRQTSRTANSFGDQGFGPDPTNS